MGVFLLCVYRVCMSVVCVFVVCLSCVCLSCICVYVVYVSLYVCIYAYAYACACVYKHVCSCVVLYMQVCECAACIHMCLSRVHVMCVSMHVCVCIVSCVYAHVCICVMCALCGMYKCMCVCIKRLMLSLFQLLSTLFHETSSLSWLVNMASWLARSLRGFPLCHLVLKLQKGASQPPVKFTDSENSAFGPHCVIPALLPLALLTSQPLCIHIFCFSLITCSKLSNLHLMPGSPLVHQLQPSLSSSRAAPYVILCLLTHHYPTIPRLLNFMCSFWNMVSCSPWWPQLTMWPTYLHLSSARIRSMYHRIQIPAQL